MEYKELVAAMASVEKTGIGLALAEQSMTTALVAAKNPQMRVDAAEGEITRARVAYTEALQKLSAVALETVGSVPKE